MKEYSGVHLNLMEVVPVYLVSHTVEVKVMMYLLKKRALREGLIDDPWIGKGTCCTSGSKAVVSQSHNN